MQSCPAVAQNGHIATHFTGLGCDDNYAQAVPLHLNACKQHLIAEPMFKPDTWSSMYQSHVIRKDAAWDAQPCQEYQPVHPQHL